MIRDLVRRAGVRRLGFAAFCLTMFLGAIVYLRGFPHDADRGFGASLPPVVLLFGLLALASPYLISRGALPTLTKVVRTAMSKVERRRFMIAAALATLVAGCLWSQRLDSSLWTDEITSVRENIVGRWKHRDDTGRMIRPTWAETLLEYHTPNNHSLFSGTARVTHELLVGVNDSDFSRPYFSEPVLRLPAFLAGLLCVPFVGYLALRMGSLLSCCLAMGWVVLHPLFLEFSTSARGYCFAMCFLTLAFVSAVRIFRDGGRWRWWFFYGLGQILAFTSIPTVAHALVTLNAAVFIGLTLDRSVLRESRGPHLRAFFATNLVALAFALAYFLPKLAPMREYMSGDLFRQKMGWDWLADSMSNFLIGQPYLLWAENHPWASSTDQWPIPVQVLAICAVLAVVASSVSLSYRRGEFASALGLAILLPPFTVFMQGRVSNFYMLPWYAVWQLPLWIAFFSAGATRIIVAIAGERSNRAWIPFAATGLLLVMIGAATHARRHAYLSISYEAMRESAALVRDSPNPYAPGHEEMITTSIVTPNHAYDPWGRRVRSEGDLRKMIELAEGRGIPLFCTTAWIDFVETNSPGIASLLLNPEYFETVGEPLYGLHKQNTRLVFRYRAGSLRDGEGASDSSAAAPAGRD
ncbi:MAG: hypothetical protein ACR2RV_29680 [Verrucomicrobiales bacterium]